MAGSCRKTGWAILLMVPLVTGCRVSGPTVHFNAVDSTADRKEKEYRVDKRRLRKGKPLKHFKNRKSLRAYEWEKRFEKWSADEDGLDEDC